MDCAEERIGGFVIARCDCPVVLEPFPVVLEPFKEILDEMPGFVERLVVVSLVFTVCFRRDHGFILAAANRSRTRASASYPLSARRMSAAISSIRTSAPSRSQACPGVR